MTEPLQFHFIGFRQIETQFYGAKCGVCQEPMEKRTKCMYNPMTKEFRHFDCNINHPANLTEIWLADVTEDDEETMERVTRRTVIITDTSGRENGMAQFRASGTTLIDLLESFPKGAKHPIAARKKHMERLGITYIQRS